MGCTSNEGLDASIGDGGIDARVPGCGAGLACEGDTPFCDETVGACVACLSTIHCSIGVCVDGACTACDPADNEGCEGTTPICNASYECEQCMVAADVCGTGRGCSVEGTCEPICGDGLVVPPEVCDPIRGPDFRGGCDACRAVLPGYYCPTPGGTCLCADDYHVYGEGVCRPCLRGHNAAGDDPYDGAVGPTTCCGDGQDNNPRHACDDGNELACGRCASPTCGPGENLRARGYITLLDGAMVPTNPNDGNTITLSDGVRVRTYEFDLNGAVSGDHVPVVIEPSDVNATAAALAAAIGPGAGEHFILIDATSTANTVFLVQGHVGTSGNIEILKTGNLGTVGGFSVGTGTACAAAEGCRSDFDCESGDCIDGGRCS